jgi:hypothetical protein
MDNLYLGELGSIDVSEVNQFLFEPLTEAQWESTKGELIGRLHNFIDELVQNIAYDIQAEDR